jgi:hypothetical protein
MRLIRRGMHRWFDQALCLTPLFYPSIVTITQVVMDSRYLLHIAGKIHKTGRA